MEFMGIGVKQKKLKWSKHAIWRHGVCALWKQLRKSKQCYEILATCA